MTRSSAAAWLVGLAACLLNLCYSCPTHGQEIARVSASGEVVVERAGSVLRVVIPTEYGRIIVEVPPTPGVPPELPPPGTDPEPPAPEPDPKPDTPSTWPALADHVMRDVPAEDRTVVAEAIVAGLEAIEATPPVRNPNDPPSLTLGQKAAAHLLDVATTYPFGDPPPKTATTILAIVRVGDVLVKAGDDARKAVAYAKELRKYLQEIASGGQ